MHPTDVDPAALERLRAYDTPTLANALDALNGVDGVDDRPATANFTRPPVHSVLPDLPPMVGLAVTATIRSSTPFADERSRADAMLPLYATVAAVPGPKVVVVQDLDHGPGCLWGEVNATICHAMGCEGVVTDGLVRDLPDVEALGFRLLARGVGLARAYVAVQQTATQVQVGGATVDPGEIVHADRHGALVIPAELVDALPASADAIIAREERLLTWVRSPTFDPADIPARRAQH
jgi:4-hydroxy-4-methyl-2-oxoglutarate aldolase